MWSTVLGLMLQLLAARLGCVTGMLLPFIQIKFGNIFVKQGITREGARSDDLLGKSVIITLSFKTITTFLIVRICFPDVRNNVLKREYGGKMQDLYGQKQNCTKMHKNYKDDSLYTVDNN